MTGAPMHANDNNELDWLAFRYIAGELSHSEAESFEQRLADDQAAREAVAVAVHLAQTTALALQHTPAPNTARRGRAVSRRWTWAAAGIAAGIALAILVSSWSRVNQYPNQDGFAERVGPEAQQLAMTWAMARTDLSVDVAELEQVAELEPGASALTEPISEVSVADEIETPSWMFVAVEGLTASSEQPTQVVE